MVGLWKTRKLTQTESAFLFVYLGHSREMPLSEVSLLKKLPLHIIFNLIL